MIVATDARTREPAAGRRQKVLTLAEGRHIGDFTVYRDSVYGTGGRSYTSTFYALPDTPRLARDAATGGPEFDFLWYRTPPGHADQRAGGLVMLTVELAPTADERTLLEQEIAAAYAPELLDDIELLSIPFSDGQVALSFAGETGDGDVAAQVAGAGPARLAGGQRATFAVDMTQDGAALLWKSIEDGPGLFHVSYDLVFDAHLDDIELRVWCDVRSSLQIASTRLSAGALAPSTLRETLTTQRVAGTQLTTQRPLAPDDEERLRDLGQQLLEAALASALFERGSGAAPPRLRPYTTEMETTLNHTFTQSFPVRRHAVLDDVIRLDADAAQLGERLRRIDLDGGFFRIMEVSVHCTVDFEHDPIDVVQVALVYDATGPTGRVVRKRDMLFRDRMAPQTFRFDLAAPDERTYSYAADVHYSDGATTRLSFAPTDATAVVLDLDGLGVLRVDVALRDVVFDIVQSVVVDLLHPPSGLTQRIILNGLRTSQTWEAVVGGSPGPYSYRVAWVTKDGRTEQPWAEAVGTRLALDMPAELRPGAEVMLVAGGDFAGLAQIVVDLRAGPQDADVASLSFTDAGQTQSWRPARSRPGPLSYELRTTIVRRDGSRETTDWRADDRPVIVVRDVLRFELSDIGRWVDFGGAVSLALVELTFDDEQTAIHERQTLVLHDRADEPRWSFRLGSPDRHTYRHRLTLVAPGGSRAVSEWHEAEASILVLAPGEQ
jgi:hypothetical protein